MVMLPKLRRRWTSYRRVAYNSCRNRQRRQGEDDMEVGHRKQLALRFGLLTRHWLPYSRVYPFPGEVFRPAPDEGD